MKIQHIKLTFERINIMFMREIYNDMQLQEKYKMIMENQKFDLNLNIWKGGSTERVCK